MGLKDVIEDKRATARAIAVTGYCRGTRGDTKVLPAEPSRKTPNRRH